MKLWANSGDSHYNEPPDLYDALPADLRAPDVGPPPLEGSDSE